MIPHYKFLLLSSSRICGGFVIADHVFCRVFLTKEIFMGGCDFFSDLAINRSNKSHETAHSKISLFHSCLHFVALVQPLDGTKFGESPRTCVWLQP
jgi:hypothetical protein